MAFMNPVVLSPFAMVQRNILEVKCPGGQGSISLITNLDFKQILGL